VGTGWIMKGWRDIEKAQGLFCEKRLRLSSCVSKCMAEKELGRERKRGERIL
jgi:hypothetical protein